MTTLDASPGSFLGQHKLLQQPQRLKQVGGAYWRPGAVANSLKEKGPLALLVSQGHLG